MSLLSSVLCSLVLSLGLNSFDMIWLGRAKIGDAPVWILLCNYLTGGSEM